MSRHKNATGTDIHVIHAFTYADAAARTGATGFVAGDVGKVAKQSDDDSYWILTVTTPTWLQIASAGLADIAALTPTDGNFIVGDGANWVAESGTTVRTSIGLGTGNDVDFQSLKIGGTEVIDSSRNLTNIVAGTFTGDVRINAGASNAEFVLNGNAATQRNLNFETAGILRWVLQADSGAEGGSDAGSDWKLLARTDAGGAIDTPWTIVRASGGLITLARPVQITGALELDGDLNHDGTNVGLYTATPVSQASHIVDADGTLADITTKFNTLLVALDADAGIGILAGV